MIEGRSSSVPFEHIVAELAAAPIAIPETLSLACHRLSPALDDGTEQVWRCTETSLLQQGAAYSVDELVALRDWLWFPNDEAREKSSLLQGLPRGQSRQNLTRYFRNLAQNTLKLSGIGFSPILPDWSNQHINVRSSSNDSLARRFWRWMSFAMPPDLLIAAHRDSFGGSDNLATMSPVIEKMLLDSGYAETHLHLGASLTFNTVWTATQYQVADFEHFNADSFKSAGAAFGDGEDLSFYMIKGLIVRYLLAGYLARVAVGGERTKMGQKRSLSLYLADHVFASGHNAEDGGINFSRPDLFNYDERELLKAVLIEMQSGEIVRTFKGARSEGELFNSKVEIDKRRAFGIVRLQRLYAKLTGINRRNGFPFYLSEVAQADPISDFFDLTASGSTNPEVDLMRSAFNYMESAVGEGDEFFAKLFWQIVRIRTQYYRHIVQRPMTPGLQWFIRHFERLKPAKQKMRAQFLTESAAIISGKDFGLKSLEVRVSPSHESVEANRALIDEVYRTVYELNNGDDPEKLANLTSNWRSRMDQKLNEHLETEAWSWDRQKHKNLVSNPRLSDNDKNINAPIELGLVFHFTRVAGDARKSGKPAANGYGTHGDPSTGAKNRNANFRYGAYYTEKKLETLALKGMMEKYPRSLNIIRAVDICTDELAIPNWVLAPLINYLRNVSRHVSKSLERQTGERVEPLRLTTHVGEDFVHLLGGLRRVDESIDYFSVGQGDRLGHAIALGIDPEQWARSTRAVAMTKMDRLFDLAWEARFSTNSQLPVSGSRLQSVTSTIETLGRFIFEDEHVVSRDVLDFTEALYDPLKLAAAGFPRARSYKDMTELTEKGLNEIEGEDRVKRLLALYLTNYRVFDRGQEPELIETSSEADQLQLLQAALRKKVGSLGIAIEINPSSNLLIGNLADLKNHPLWRLKPPIDSESETALSVCIGSDDPITFGTDTRFEYQLVYDTLLLSGVSDFHARSWIEDARSVGMNNRFTRMVDIAPEDLWRQEKNQVFHNVAPPP